MGEPSLSDRVRALRLDGRVPERGRSSAAWLPWLLCFAMAAAWVGVGSRWYATGGDQPEPAAAPAAPSDPERPRRPRDDNQPKDVTHVQKGYIIPAHRISVSPIEVSGQVVELNIEEGRAFKAGDLLARIDDTVYAADLAEVRATLAAAQARYEEVRTPRPEAVKQAEAELAEAKELRRQAELDFQRKRTLVQSRSIPPEQFESAKYGFQAAQMRVEALQQRLTITRRPRAETVAAAKAEADRAAASVRRAEYRLKQCRILAPVTGTVLTKRAEIGSLINPVVGGVSTSLCDIADLSDLEVEVEIQERDLNKVRVGQACLIRADVRPDYDYDGYVDRLMPIAQRSNGAIPVRVKIVLPAGEQGQYLKPEMNPVVTFLNKQTDARPAGPAARTLKGRADD